MPTTTVEYDPTKGYDEILDWLADEIPGIVAPQMNVSGRKLHDGGVSENEIIVRFMEFSPRDRNIEVGIELDLVEMGYAKI